MTPNQLPQDMLNAIRKDNINLVSLLLSGYEVWRVYVNRINFESEALYLAIERNNTHLVSLLLKFNFYVDGFYQGYAPLHIESRN